MTTEAGAAAAAGAPIKAVAGGAPATSDGASATAATTTATSTAASAAAAPAVDSTTTPAVPEEKLDGKDLLEALKKQVGAMEIDPWFFLSPPLVLVWRRDHSCTTTCIL